MSGICSKHKDHDPDCRLCNMTKWVNVGTQGHCDHGREPSQDDINEVLIQELQTKIATLENIIERAKIELQKSAQPFDDACMILRETE